MRQLVATLFVGFFLAGLVCGIEFERWRVSRAERKRKINSVKNNETAI